MGLRYSQLTFFAIRFAASFVSRTNLSSRLTCTLAYTEIQTVRSYLAVSTRFSRWQLIWHCRQGFREQPTIEVLFPLWLRRRSKPLPAWPGSLDIRACYFHRFHSMLAGKQRPISLQTFADAEPTVCVWFGEKWL